MKKLILSTIISTVVFGNIAFANTCPNPPILKESIAKQYSEIELKACQEQQEFWRVKRDGKIGVIDNKGNIIIPFYYDYVGKWSKSSDYLSVALGDKDRPFLKAKWGIIDKTGKEVIAPQYDYIYPISDTLFVVEKQQATDIEIDITKGSLEQMDNIMNMIFMFQGFGFPVTNHNTKIGLVDVNNTLLLPIEYDGYRDIDKDFINIYKDGKALLIDKQGEILKTQ
ncbi:WG repeat-containing protein [Moraxella sp. ZY210820]|uniref:WG repeat-containing protein n=1 Tax=unclassified Moraxella TaxID=2685852 RepID=UPI002731DFE3|nr:WG repeat-containing protein [Moraxella sp. ZY210820]WLF84678.1 WG repeat-containing protein [Moraxella sp. ZY210820]